MGDVVSFVEKAQEVFDEKQAKELERKLRKDEFTLEDFRDQLKQMKQLGIHRIYHRHDSGVK